MRETFWDDGHVLYFDRDLAYIGYMHCQHSSNGSFNICTFHYIHISSRNK